MAWLVAPTSDGATAFLTPSMSRAACTAGARANRLTGPRKAAAVAKRAKTRIVVFWPAGADIGIGLYGAKRLSRRLFLLRLVDLRVLDELASSDAAIRTKLESYSR